MSQQAWIKVQQKTFTKWVNSHLGKRGRTIEDLQTCFKTGVDLINLLEIIGEESIGRFNKNPRMEIQMRENIDKALKYIAGRGVKLTAIGSGDIYEGNLKLILGMIWTVILRFQIAAISVEELTAKEALLLWCQRKTASYENVNIKEFTWSWQDGLGFCALIHAHRPDLIDYHSLSKENKAHNLNLAFQVAEDQLGIPQFLESEDMVDVKPDERSVMTYLSEYFKHFSKGLKAETAGRRITKVVLLIRQLREQKKLYNDRAQKLVDKILRTIKRLDDRNFPTSISGVKGQLDKFKEYKKTEKPELSSEKLEVTSDLGQLNTKLRVNSRNSYNPPSGLSLEDINDLWVQLEGSEINRSRALRESLQKLNNELIQKFEEMAGEFEIFCSETTDNIHSLKGDLNQQINEIDNILSNIDGKFYDLEEIKKCSKEVEKANLEYNTEVSYDVLERLYEDLKMYAKSTRDLIQNQMAVNAGAKVTQEQLSEFKKMFELFDRDKKGSLYDYEFSAVLNSLGDDLDDHEVKAVFDKYDTDHNGTIEFDEFVEFMIARTEDSDNKQQIYESWKVLTGGQEFVREQQMKQAGMGKVVEFLMEDMPNLGEGKGWKPYTDEILYN